MSAKASFIRNTSRGMALMGVCLLTLLALGASTARAGSITVWGCHQPSGEIAPLDGWDWHASATGIYPNNTCSSPGAQFFGMGIYQEYHPNNSYGSWQFNAPPSTTISAFRYRRGVGITGYTDFTAFRGSTPAWDSHILESCWPPTCSSLPEQEKTFNLSGERALLLYLRACTQAAGCNEFSSGWLAVNILSVTLDDQQGPTFSGLTGSLVQPGPLRGSASLNMQLADAGTGLYLLHATVDGRSFDDRVLDANGGKCRPVTRGRDFMYVVPCRLTMSAATTLDTSSLVDGSHDVSVSVEDAAGNATTIFHGAVTTANAPANLAAPEIIGTARVGGAMVGAAGSWSPAPSSLAYQWLRCPASGDVGGCSAIAGATSFAYAPTSADAYGRLRMRAIASNASGSTSAISAPSDIVADAEGRTTPPPPSGGGLTVGAGNYSITTNINAPADADRLISGLVNPLSFLAGHVANGSHAAELVQIKIAFMSGRAQVTTVRSTRSRSWRIAGRLSNSLGQPIGGAVLIPAWELAIRGWAAKTPVRTDPDGTFSYLLPPGPSRQLKFAYFAFSDSHGYSESNTITEKVTTPVRLRARPRALHNGQTVRFSGTIGPDSIPRVGVLITLEARAPGTGWTKFNVIRSTQGRFTARYRFRRTSRRTRYQFRALVAKQAGYPYEGGTSRTVNVMVSP